MSLILGIARRRGGFLCGNLRLLGSDLLGTEFKGLIRRFCLIIFLPILSCRILVKDIFQCALLISPVFVNLYQRRGLLQDY